jgi:uncharacterized phiE125 gp8 family phage protein
MMDLRYKLKTAPTTYPASLADLKRNLRIPTADVDTDRDTLLQDLLYEAVIASQNATGRQYCPATYILYLDEYPENDEVEITLGPVSEIVSVKYYAQGSASLTTVAAADYQLDNSELTARLRFLESFTPDTDKMNVIEIEFETGWAAIGNQADALPTDLKQAVILRASEAYLRPENAIQNFGFSVATKSAQVKERNYKVQRY